MAKETEKEPILLQDGTIVKTGILIYRVHERNIFDPKYENSRRAKKRSDELTFPQWSGELTHTINADKVIRVQEGFNSRVFITRDKKGVERNYTVNHFASTRRFDCTEMVFGSKKKANKFVYDKNRYDLSLIQKKVDLIMSLI